MRTAKLETKKKSQNNHSSKLIFVSINYTASSKLYFPQIKMS